MVWSDAGLANGTHTIKIVLQGTKPAASSGTYAQVDAFVYGTQATSLLATAPLVTLTDNNAGCSSAENYPATQAPTITQGALVDTGNVVNVYLDSGAAGLQSGSCT